MNPKRLALVSLVFLLLVPIASATSSCPAGRTDFSPYNKVELYSFKDGKWTTAGYKFVNEAFKIIATRVDGQQKEEEPLPRRSVNIYYLGVDGTQEILKNNGYTNSNGEYEYTPTQLGKYKIECGGRALILTIYELLDEPSDFGAVCGNGICESDKLENQINCAADCTVCGDAVCEGLENKENCPDDCIICGDGECDPEEYSPTSCSCIEDCIICGDGLCDTAHGEVCPEDCGKEEKEGGTTIEDLLEKYWWAIAIIVLIIVLFYFKETILDKIYDFKHRNDDDEKKPLPTKKKKRDVFEEDENIHGIILELMDAGISDRRIKSKLNEFGLDDDECDKLIENAKNG